MIPPIEETRRQLQQLLLNHEKQKHGIQSIEKYHGLFPLPNENQLHNLLIHDILIFNKNLYLVKLQNFVIYHHTSGIKKYPIQPPRVSSIQNGKTMALQNDSHPAFIEMTNWSRSEFLNDYQTEKETMETDKNEPIKYKTRQLLLTTTKDLMMHVLDEFMTPVSSIQLPFPLLGVSGLSNHPFVLGWGIGGILLISFLQPNIEPEYFLQKEWVRQVISRYIGRNQYELWIWTDVQVYQAILELGELTFSHIKIGIFKNHQKNIPGALPISRMDQCCLLSAANTKSHFSGGTFHVLAGTESTSNSVEGTLFLLWTANTNEGLKMRILSKMSPNRSKVVGLHAFSKVKDTSIFVLYSDGSLFWIDVENWKIIQKVSLQVSCSSLQVVQTENGLKLWIGSEEGIKMFCFYDGLRPLHGSGYSSLIRKSRMISSQWLVHPEVQPPPVAPEDEKWVLENEDGSLRWLCPRSGGTVSVMLGLSKANTKIIFLSHLTLVLPSQKKYILQIITSTGELWEWNAGVNPMTVIRRFQLWHQDQDSDFQVNCLDVWKYEQCFALGLTNGGILMKQLKKSFEHLYFESEPNQPLIQDAFYSHPIQFLHKAPIVEISCLRHLSEKRLLSLSQDGILQLSLFEWVSVRERFGQSTGSQSFIHSTLLTVDFGHHMIMEIGLDQQAKPFTSEKQKKKLFNGFVSFSPEEKATQFVNAKEPFLLVKVLCLKETEKGHHELTKRSSVPVESAKESNSSLFQEYLGQKKRMSIRRSSVMPVQVQTEPKMIEKKESKQKKETVVQKLQKAFAFDIQSFRCDLNPLLKASQKSFDDSKIEERKLMHGICCLSLQTQQNIPFLLESTLTNETCLNFSYLESLHLLLLGYKNHLVLQKVSNGEKLMTFQTEIELGPSLFLSDLADLCVIYGDSLFYMPSVELLPLGFLIEKLSLIKTEQIKERPHEDWLIFDPMVGIWENCARPGYQLSPQVQMLFTYLLTGHQKNQTALESIQQKILDPEVLQQRKRQMDFLNYEKQFYLKSQKFQPTRTHLHFNSSNLTFKELQRAFPIFKELYGNCLQNLHIQNHNQSEEALQMFNAMYRFEKIYQVWERTSRETLLLTSELEELEQEADYGDILEWVQGLGQYSSVRCETPTKAIEEVIDNDLLLFYENKIEKQRLLLENQTEKNPEMKYLEAIIEKDATSMEIYFDKETEELKEIKTEVEQKEFEERKIKLEKLNTKQLETQRKLQLLQNIQKNLISAPNSIEFAHKLIHDSKHPKQQKQKLEKKQKSIHQLTKKTEKIALSADERLKMLMATYSGPTKKETEQLHSSESIEVVALEELNLEPVTGQLDSISYRKKNISFSVFEMKIITSMQPIIEASQIYQPFSQFDQNLQLVLKKDFIRQEIIEYFELNSTSSNQEVLEMTLLKLVKFINSNENVLQRCEATKAFLFLYQANSPTLIPRKESKVKENKKSKPKKSKEKNKNEFWLKIWQEYESAFDDHKEQLRLQMISNILGYHPVLQKQSLKYLIYALQDPSDHVKRVSRNVLMATGITTYQDLTTLMIELGMTSQNDLNGQMNQMKKTSEMKVNELIGKKKSNDFDKEGVWDWVDNVPVELIVEKEIKREKYQLQGGRLYIKKEGNKK